MLVVTVAAAPMAATMTAAQKPHTCGRPPGGCSLALLPTSWSSTVDSEDDSGKYSRASRNAATVPPSAPCASLAPSAAVPAPAAVGAPASNDRSRRDDEREPAGDSCATTDPRRHVDGGHEVSSHSSYAHGRVLATRQALVWFLNVCLRRRLPDRPAGGRLERERHGGARARLAVASPCPPGRLLPWSKFGQIAAENLREPPGTMAHPQTADPAGLPVPGGAWESPRGPP